MDCKITAFEREKAGVVERLTLGKIELEMRVLDI
jgi:hypothetical protein